jgi:hypothetical protein
MHVQSALWGTAAAAAAALDGTRYDTLVGSVMNPPQL